ncbi:bifunctional DNA primase/polymerase, partial [Candidatus Darwinibacter acetoxidans]
MGDNIFIKLREAGISSIPVNSEKKPMLETWKFLQERLPSIAECEKFNNKNKYGVGVVCGAVSGNLEVIDIDNKNGVATEIFEDICKQITINRIDLFDKLVIEKSIRNGYHLIYRCDKIEGSRKLALQKNKEDGKIYADIETRGEGGYCVVYPTPGYERIQKNVLKVEKITVEERDFLFELCLMFNKYVEEKPTFTNFKQAFSEKSGDRIGDFYNERNDFIDILKKHDWTIEKEESDKIHFRRPGKNKGNSATFLFEPRLFYVFSSNAYPFEEQKSYSPFAIFTLLECNGDFNESPKKLAELYPEFNKKVQINDKNTNNTAQNEKKSEQKYDVFEFWKYKNKDNNELIIDLKKLAQFLYRNDFFYYYKDKDSNVLVREIAKNIIEQVTENYIIKFLQDYIKSLPNDYYYDNNEQFDKNYLIELLSVLNKRNLENVLHNLERRELEFNKDTEDTCYKYFKNCIVKITATKVEYLDYSDLKKYIWRENIIDREYHTQDPIGKVSEVFEFHKLVTSSRNVLGEVVPNPQRHNALR